MAPHADTTADGVQTRLQGLYRIAQARAAGNKVEYRNLIGKLQGEAVPFEMMLYPGFTHRIGGPKVGKHLYETVFRFLDRHGVGSGQ